MTVAVVDVRAVRMLVGDGLVAVKMAVRFDDRAQRGIVGVVVVLVVDVPVLVLEGLVGVAVGVPLAQQQDHAA